MKQAALWINDDVEREIVRLEQGVDALKDRISEARSGARGEAITAAQVRAVLRARRAREALISRELFADAAWDILLELYASSLSQQRVSTTELTLASAVPATTALRWMEKLEDLGLLNRHPDRLDGRRVWVEISAEGEEKMRCCFEAIRSELSRNW